MRAATPKTEKFLMRQMNRIHLTPTNILTIPRICPYERHLTLGVNVKNCWCHSIEMLDSHNNYNLNGYGFGEGGGT